MGARKQSAEDMLPGMPDAVHALPPKAGDGEWEGRTLDEAITRSHQILDEALATYPEIVGVYWLSSGGNDSGKLGHLLRGRYDAVLHVNTGTGIPETTQYVHDVATAWGDTLHELQPKDSYQDLILGKVIATRGPNAGKRAVWEGFPGPAGHRVMYRHLKDEPLMAFRRSVLGDQTRLPRKDRKKIAYLGGMRWAESQRRFRNAEAIDQDGAIVWVSPIVHWTDAHMREYQLRHRCEQDHEHAPHRLCFEGALPLNEVTAHLHMSGECLCGAFAKPGELDEIRFFYPKVSAVIEWWESEARRAGVVNCRWGVKPDGKSNAAAAAEEIAAAGRLCSSCTDGDPTAPVQDSLEDIWFAAGLISAEQRDRLHAEIAEEAS
jgi:3'-phosphoadenosine 5'-phosphosulfate sulfotransferase (PAPS reductase)/FAD synthetase